jgi:curved DNA-binding protein CbpA
VSEAITTARPFFYVASFAVDYTKNYYAVLGVLPSAEIVVIRAAYRALALRYHPDTWAGEKQHAERKMREINEAYEVLSEDASRKEYDGNRQKRGFEEYEFENDQTEEAFRDSADANSSDWDIAVEYFPELATLHAKLRATSARLAFAFQTTTLERKQFEQCNVIAADLEGKFLQSYFGSNPQILAYARQLIAIGAKPAAKELNRAVAVLGSNVDPDLVIGRIQNKFFTAEIAARELAVLMARLVDRRHVEDAIAVVQKLKGSVDYGQNHAWFVPKTKIRVVCLNQVATFATEPEMVSWVISNVVPKIKQL